MPFIPEPFLSSLAVSLSFSSENALERTMDEPKRRRRSERRRRRSNNYVPRQAISSGAIGGFISERFETHSSGK